MTTSTLPAGSAIGIRPERDHTALEWAPPKGGILRYGVAFFLLCWIGGWAWGLVATLGELLQGTSKAPKVFLLFWLGGWIAGGGMAILVLTRLLKPARNERLLLYRDRVIHDPGLVPFNPFSGGMSDGRRFWGEMFKRRMQAEIAQRDAGEVRLERVGERLRLTIDRGAERIEVGEHLGEPDKEWLAKTLRAWRAA